jgi:hypothetical protein
MTACSYHCGVHGYNADVNWTVSGSKCDHGVPAVSTECRWFEAEAVSPRVDSYRKRARSIRSSAPKGKFLIAKIVINSRGG